MTSSAAQPAAPAPGDWNKALGLLATSGPIVLAGHMNPDGDALGSALALGLGLRGLGRDVVVTFSDPFRVPESLQILPGRDLLVPPAELPAAPDLLVSLDAASASRLGTVAELVDRAGEVIVVDHHASNTGFGGIQLVDPTAAATGMLVAELIERLGVPYDAEIASCLYAAIASDTGSFRHAGATPAVHRLVARLLETGFRHEAVSRSLFDTHPPGWLPMLASVLARVAVEVAEAGGAGLVWTAVTTDDLETNDLPPEQAESVIDIVRTSAVADVAAVLKQTAAPDTWSVSTRSRGQVDVGAVCVALGGGGHPMAAGYTAHGSVDTVIGELRYALRAAPRLAG